MSSQIWKIPNKWMEKKIDARTNQICFNDMFIGSLFFFNIQKKKNKIKTEELTASALLSSVLNTN